MQNGIIFCHSVVLRFCHLNGGVAQLGERLLCKQEVIGSIPFTSTRSEDGYRSSDIGTDGGEGGAPKGGCLSTRNSARRSHSRGARERLAGLLIERVKRRVVRDRGGRRLGRGCGAMPCMPGSVRLPEVSSGEKSCRVQRWTSFRRGSEEPVVGRPPDQVRGHRSTNHRRCLRLWSLAMGSYCWVRYGAKRRASGGCLGTERR
jgi:hypothetical protein